MKNRFAAAAGLTAAIALMLAAAPAAARVNVDLHIGIPAGGYAYPVYPAPVYAPPPAPVYAQPYPVYVQPSPVYIARDPYCPPRHFHHHSGARWDRDGDGVANRWDRRPNNPYRY